MLPSKTAQQLLPLVNGDIYEDLTMYAKFRIERLTENLYTCDTPNEMARLQGAIAELKRLITLRDEVNTDSKQK